MSTNDKIQLGILIVLTATLIVIAFQIHLYNRLLKAQLLRDRFDMYWSLDSIKDEEIDELHLVPDDYIDHDKYEKEYKSDKQALHKYLYFFQIYEYLGFQYKLKEFNLPDPLKYDWTLNWTIDLLEHKEFIDVHEYHKRFYEEFAKVIDSHLSQKKKKVT
jgi:hypothetical protein